MRSSRPSLAPSASAADPVEIPDRECDPPDVELPVAELIVLPRRAFGESPFTKTSLPCSSTWIAIWARNGVESANSAPAASTATGMQFLFMVLLFATTCSGRRRTTLQRVSGKAERFTFEHERLVASCKRETHIRRRRRLLRRKHLAQQQL